MTPGPGIFRTQLPAGFLAGGINCGVRRYRPDLGIIISEGPCSAAGVFTTSSAAAASIIHGRSLLPSNSIRAILTNSGQANAATGEQGVKDNAMLAQLTAETVGCNANQVLIASTGVIGEPLAMGPIAAGIPLAYAAATTIAEPFATAIMTTDLVPKTVQKDVVLSKGSVRITGVCKGSGMIHPNMATMLGYLLTDAVLTPEQAHSFLKTVTDVSFNMISVDGETSTNDVVYFLANGYSEVDVVSDADQALFLAALQEVSICLAQSIARDGEGATKLIECTVSGAVDAAQARAIARDVIQSPLIKTAIHGNSPNWGRVLARVGKSEVPIDNLDVSFQGIMVFQHGGPLGVANATLKEALKKDFIVIEIDLNLGSYSATAWGCDLSKSYVEINAEYVS
jgi:glutamate N-acetyltransferase / amino-acid N-acetyltransferase